MSRDSQAGKESRTQRNTDNPTSGRSEGDQAAHNEQEEVTQIPENKVGIVKGKKGWRWNDIKERSGVQALVIKDWQVCIKGTEEQRTKAKTLIYRILNTERSYIMRLRCSACQSQIPTDDQCSHLIGLFRTQV